MSSQVIKTVYFPDPGHKERLTYGRRVAVPFNVDRPRERIAAQIASGKTSAEIREVLGLHTYRELKKEAGSQKPAIFIRESLLALRANMKPADRQKIIRANRAALDFDRVNLVPCHDPELFLEDPTEVTRALLREHVPNAKRVLDPFAGTGNIPIAAAQAGAEAFYCEIDPLYRMRAQLKMEILARGTATRQALATALRNRRRRLVNVPKYDVAPDLERRWESLAIPRERHPEALDFFLRLRKRIDEEDDVLLARCLEAAGAEAAGRVLSGRVRQGSAARDSERARGACVQELSRLVVYLKEEPQLAKLPVSVTADAKDLGDVCPLSIDAVITNPPSPLPLGRQRNAIARWFLRMPLDVRPPAEPNAVDLGAHLAMMTDVMEAVEKQLAAATTFILDVEDINAGEKALDWSVPLVDLLVDYGFRTTDERPVLELPDGGTRRFLVLERRERPRRSRKR